MFSKCPKWKNFFENDVTVQFMHRNLVTKISFFFLIIIYLLFKAYLTLFLITMTWIVGRKMNLNSRSKYALHSLLAMGYVQAFLGISTLVNFTNNY